MGITKDGKAKLRSIVREKADRIFNSSQENIIRDGHVDRSGLLLSGKIIEKEEIIQIIYDAPHAKPGEFGSKPHWTSYKNLMPWVRRKLGITNIKEAEGVARAIVAKIAKQGTEPMFYMKKAIESNRDR